MWHFINFPGGSALGSCRVRSVLVSISINFRTMVKSMVVVRSNGVVEGSLARTWWRSGV